MEKYRPSIIYIILFLILLITSLYITFHDKSFFKPVLKFISPRNASHRNVSSNIYLHVKLDLTKNTALCKSNDSLIIYVLSKINHIERRKVIRSTWASPLNNTCFVFILGESIGFNARMIQSRINDEKRQYKDIIQIDHNETYENVIYKEIAILIWSHAMYPSIPYLFKTDDDLIIDPILILNIAQLLLTNISNNDSYISKYHPRLVSDVLSSDRSTFFRGGWSMDYQPTLRGGGKFGIDKKVWPHPNLPLYCSGFGWFMSNTVRNRLLQASYTYPNSKIVWIGDVFLSGFVAKEANVKCNGMSLEFEQTFTGNCSCLMAERPMLIVCSSTFHGGIGINESAQLNEYVKAWKVTQRRHNSTNSTDNTC